MKFIYLIYDFFSRVIKKYTEISEILQKFQDMPKVSLNIILVLNETYRH